MTTPPAQTLWIAGDTRKPLDDSRLGKHRLELRRETVAGEARLLDTFDGQVAAAGLILAEQDGALLLFGGQEGPVWQETAPPGFVQDMPEGPVQAALAAFVSPLRRLTRTGTVGLDLRSMALVDEISKTLVRCEFAVFSAEGGQPVSLIRMQPLRGYERALPPLAEALGTLNGAEPFSAAQAIAALLPGSTGYIAKPDVRMTAKTSAFGASRAIIRSYIAVARQNEPGVIADIDSEFLHDYRVALRKIRSLLSLFKGVYQPDVTEDLKARFGALMARTGRLRDLDVYLLERETYLDLVPAPLRPGLETLFDDFAREREAEQEALATHLQGKAYAREMRSLEKRFDKPGKHLKKGEEAATRAVDLARRLIWKRYRKVLAIAAKIDDRTPDEQVHELRIHSKKLRYLMEFFAPLFAAKEIKPLIKALKKMQEVLGEFNDCAVQQEALAGRLDAMKDTADQQRLEVATSLGALLTVLDQRQQEARARVVASFEAFDAPATQRGFKTLFRTGRKAA